MRAPVRLAAWALVPLLGVPAGALVAPGGMPPVTPAPTVGAAPGSPYATASRVVLTRWSDGSTGQCSGTLAGPDAVLTAGHCVLGPGRRAVAVVTVAATPDAPVCHVTNVLLPQDFARAPDGHQPGDWAVLRLAGCAAGAPAPMTRDTATGGPVVLAGFPGPAQRVSLRGTLAGTATSATWRPRLVVAADAAAWSSAWLRVPGGTVARGTSGGGAWCPGAGGPVVCGVVSGSSTDAGGSSTDAVLLTAAARAALLGRPAAGTIGWPLSDR